MKISTGNLPTPAAAASAAAEAMPAAPAPAAAAPAGASGHAGVDLQSAVLQPALNAMREMPAIDHAKVAALREALAKGEIPFDAGKLAGLVERFHRSRS